MSGPNHTKSIPLQGFKGFKLKNNCQLLFKANFKNATSKPLVVKKDDKSHVNESPTKPPPPNTSPSKTANQLLPAVACTAADAVKEVHLKNASSKESVEDKVKQTPPKKDLPVLLQSPKHEERSSSSHRSHSSSSEKSGRHRSPIRIKRSPPRERHHISHSEKKHSRSHVRHSHSSDERHSPKRRRTNDSSRSKSSSRKRHVVNGLSDTSDYEVRRSSHDRRSHRSPDKHLTKKARTIHSDGDLETRKSTATKGDISINSSNHVKSDKNMLKNSEEIKLPPEKEKSPKKPKKQQQSAVPLASIGCWLEDEHAIDEDYEDADSDIKEKQASVVESDASTNQGRNVFDTLLSEEQEEMNPQSLDKPAPSTNNENKPLVEYDHETMSVDSVNRPHDVTSTKLSPSNASDSGLQSENVILAEKGISNDPDEADDVKTKHQGEAISKEDNSIDVSMTVSAPDPIRNDEESISSDKQAIDACNDEEKGGADELAENITEELQPSVEALRKDNKPVGLFNKLNSQILSDNIASEQLPGESAENPVQNEEQHELNETNFSISSELSNSKPVLPAKKRRHQWFKVLAEEEKHKEPPPAPPAPPPHHETKPSTNSEQVVTKPPTAENIALHLEPGSPESPLFSAGSESPLQAPQMTAFDDLSSASGTEDYDPVVEIRIPIDEEEKLPEKSNVDDHIMEVDRKPGVTPSKVVEIPEVPVEPIADEREMEVSDASATDDGCRRSARIKTLQEKVKPRTLLRVDSGANKSDSEINTGSPKPDGLTNGIDRTLYNKIAPGEITTCQEQPPSFEVIPENIYLSQMKKSRVRKEIRRMVCECANAEEDGRLPCGENCLNRLLMIECSSRCPFGDQCSNKRFQRYEYEPTQVFRTSWKGWGLQASQAIGAGSLVMEYCGEVLDQAEFERRSQVYAMENQQHFYFMALSQDEIIDAKYKGNISRFINHSCDPNCETQKWTVNGRLRVGFFSIRDISKGEEITFDYQFERYGREAQKCYCGSTNCRGFLGKAPSEENDEWKWKKWDVLPAAPADQEQDKKKKKRKKEFEDNTLENEVYRLRNGLQNNKEVLLLSRSMVRCDTTNQRLLCLKALCSTENQACLRSFLQLHGLPLLWSWMVDLNATSTSDVDLPSSQLRVEILNTLSVLPITNRNILEDSKVLSMVKRWSEEEQGIQESIESKNSEVDEKPEAPSSDEKLQNDETNTDSIETKTNDSTTAEKMDQSDADNATVEASLDKAVENQQHMEQSLKISSLTAKLLDLWKDLKEIYRIPKRQRSPIKLPQGGDSERSIEDRSSSQASSPSLGYHGDGSSHDNDRDRSPLRSREWDRNRARDGDRRRRSPLRRSRDVDSKYGRQGSNERDDSGKYSWLNETPSSRMSREEHRRQFERDVKIREDDKRKKDATRAPPGGLPVWPHPAPNVARLAAAEGNPPQVIPPVQDTATFTPSGYSGNLIQINPIPEPPLLPTPVVFPAQDAKQGAYAYDSQALLQNTITVTPSTQEPILHLEPTQTTAENFSAILHSFPQAATYPSGISVLSSHSNQAIVLLTTDQLNALLTSLPPTIPEPAVVQPTLTAPTPAQIPSVITNTEPAATPSVHLEEPDDMGDSNSKAASPPRDPRPPRLPPNWKTASDADGCVYYYHVITRQTQWEPPTWDGTEEDLIGKKEGEMDISSTPTSEDGNKKQISDKLSAGASIATDTESAKKSREAFRSKMSQHVVQCLSSYRKPDCKVGRITSTEDFKHLARKLTHNVLMKELKQVQVWEDLECNANVKHKAKEYVKKYMAKCGPIYKGRDDDQR